MSDVFTKAKRSEVMSRIRARGNRDTELALAALFRRHGITGWRRQIQMRIAEGGVRNEKADASRISFRTPRSAFRVFSVRPDFVFPKLRLAVFVDGCFWHACPIHATKPRNNAAFWRKKLAANKARDRKVNRALRAAGWRVLRIWEHELHPRGRRTAERGRGRRKPSTPQPEPERRRPRRLSASAHAKPARTLALRPTPGPRVQCANRSGNSLPVRGGEGDTRLLAKLRKTLAA